ncbi:unnamed protein product [Prorocentrum cordatum]|uniref:PROP1-like PPR domain-containing protein n=1 Tax=Prorocentrum cordatum TaxID=2364126 RepID=A0ABN9TNQ5_9DINO|nr:unnamed protein product [Polarella glacialis]
MEEQTSDHVVEAFVGLREEGMHLCATAYRCIMVAHERTEPVFTLRLYRETVLLGVKIDRVAFNAVLCACSRLGMTKQALELFEQMPELGLVPNGKTYGCLIRVCTGGRKIKQALELFESMRTASIEPNRFTFRDAIRCCVELGKLDEAYDLYREMAPANEVSCSSMRMHILDACRKSVRLSVADRIQADIGPMGLEDGI